MKGKDKCEFLKGIRKRMAEANGIPYEPRECTYEGDCTGTCPFCEKEAAELMAKIRKKEAEGDEIKKDDVGMLAIELGINECEGTDEEDQRNEIDLKGAEGTLVIGDAEKKKEMEKLIQMEEKPLRGEIPTPEELRRIEEKERLRREEEYRREIEKREKRDKGFLNKVINRIKSFFEPTLMGKVDV